MLNKNSIRYKYHKVVVANLVEHAERELELAGMMDGDVDGDETLGDYNNMVADAVLELIETFASQGHSGFSAEMARELFNELSGYKSLTPLSSDTEEWEDRSEMSGYPMWQNKRDSTNFSKDGGETWVNLDDEDEYKEYWDEESLKKESKKGVTYDKSSTQIDLPKELADKVKKWGKDNIPEEEVYTDPKDKSLGRENEIHTTVLYGLNTNDIEEVKKVISYVEPFEIKFDKVSIFDGNKKPYDVVKIEVKSPELNKLHYFLEENIDNENSYPEYKPHITIAYVKKGEGKKYVGKDVLGNGSFMANKIVFSPSKGNKGSIILKESIKEYTSEDIFGAYKM